MHGEVHEELFAAAEKAAGSRVAFACRHPVAETSSRGVWEGIVSEFVSYKAERVYAWVVKDDDDDYEYIAVVKDPSMKNPSDAVRAWLNRSHPLMPPGSLAD